MPRRAAKVDSNHGEIVRALEQCGWLVCSLAPLGKGVPDLLIYKAGKFVLVEVKSPKGAFNKLQGLFQAQGWPVVLIRTIDDVLRLNRPDELSTLWPLGCRVSKP